MSIATVRVENARQFKERLYSLKMPQGDKVNTTPLKADEYAVSHDIIQDYFQYTLPENTVQWGSQTNFKIPRTSGRIYELFLEITMAADAASYCPYTAAAIVKQYQVFVGNQLINCSGSSMFMNRQQNLEVHGREFFAAAAGGATGAVASGSCFLVLDYPGAYSVSIPGATSTHEQSYSIPFPLNKCNNDMMIYVTLPNMADVASATVGVPQLKLWYQTVWSSDPEENSINNTVNSKPIYIPGYYLTNYEGNPATLSTSEVGLNISSAIQDGQMLNLMVQLQSAAQITSKAYLTGLPIASMRLNVGGVDYFKSYNNAENNFRQGLGLRQNAFEDGELDPKFYSIWGVTDPFLIGSDEYLGINTYRNNPQLYVSTTSAIGAGIINVTSVTKVVYIIDTYGMVDKFWASK